MIERNAYRIIVVTAIIIVAFSCSSKTSGGVDNFEFYQRKYAIAIKTYSAPEDSLKLKALNLLLHNLHDQYSFQGAWIEAYNTAIINSKDNSIKGLFNMFDSIKKHYSTELIRVKDQDFITDSFLIENIDKAFESLKFPWSKDLPFIDFCEYVLPYKIGNEKPEPWRDCLQTEAYLHSDSLIGIENLFEATTYVNDHLAKWYRGTVNYDYPIDLGYKMSHIIGTGTCYSIGRMALFQMRALGLPIVMDYCPSWGNRSLGHYWNSLIYKGKPYPFDPSGPNIGFYKIGFKGVNRLSYKISKVFRRTFSVQKNSLSYLNDSSELIPTVLDNKRIQDVTNQYVPVSDVHLTYNNIKFANRFAYLCTFDDKNWTPCFWGVVEGNKITFSNMGRDVLYLPTMFSSSDRVYSNLVPIGCPFILTSDGKIKELKSNNAKTVDLVITRKYPEDETNTIVKGDKYELFYWDAEWRSLGVQIAATNKLYYKGPANAIFWIRNLTKGRQERIFTFENGQQVWW